MTLLELAEACERADGADGLLDGAIGNACGFRSHGDGYGAPPFTGSLDAAMQLVPDGMRWCVDTCADEPRSFVEPLYHYDGQPYWGRAATPALALCAAALRARHAMESE